ncbi:MAG: membrane protein insertase YidC [Polyangiales bacterium]
MDRSNLSRILLAVMVFLGVYLLFNKGCGKEKTPNTNLVYDGTVPLPLPEGQTPGAPCMVETGEYKALVGGKAGGLISFELKGDKYVEDGKPIDLAKRTTVDVAGNPIFDYAPLRTTFRNDLGAETQVPGDVVEFKSEKKGDSCVLTHVTPGLVEITRIVKPGARPYEVELETTVKNLAKEPRKHAFATSLFALQFKSQEGGMFSRPAPNALFKAGCSANAKPEFHDKGSLHEWKITTGNVDFAAISSNYLGQAIVPDGQGARCAVIAQDRGVPGTASEQSLFRASIAYPQRELAPEGSATYRQTAFMGPKERSLLTAAGGGRHLDELIELGMFAMIAKQLVRFLAFVHGMIGSWGIAIILLTVTVRLALLPLTLPQIKSSLAMRRLKPEIDALNAKFEHDPQAKMLATSQLYKKYGVNPLAGCLPAVLQMPVWFALYTALQTAMELYHEKFFLWHDLSAPDPRFILPAVLGATMFIQQKVTPMQMDPAQQKVFLYFMPAMFTVFMLFLPAGLGVYMLTNSILGITQTLAVERYYQKNQPVTGADVKVVQTDEKPSTKEPRPSRELARKGD